MEEDKYTAEAGQDKAWRELAAADPSVVCINSGASYDHRRGIYTLAIMGETYEIDPQAHIATNTTNPDRSYEYLLNLSVPIYLTNAKNIPTSGELVKEFKGGDFFFRGTHVLPLDAIAAKYATDRDFFVRAGRSFGGTPLNIADSAFTFNFFPRIVMAFVMYFEDDEFPARTMLLFDSTADRHMPLDVVWSCSLVACQRMVGFEG